MYWVKTVKKSGYDNVRKLHYNIEPCGLQKHRIIGAG